MTPIAPAQTDAAAVARRYFDAIIARDIDGLVACWAPGQIDHMIGRAELRAPDGIREWFGQLFDAFPDFEFEVVDMTTEDERAAVRWRGRGTFAGPGTFDGLEPNGARVEFVGCDVLEVRDGLIQHNEAYADSMTVARQLGLLPPLGSTTEQRMTKAFNAKTRMGRRMTAGDVEHVADGVWLIRGGFPSKEMNVYLLEDEGGLTVFDAGVESMTRAVAAAAVGMGGIKRVVLGHSHADHRGTAPGLHAPVYCHPAERADAEGDGGEHYFEYRKLYPVVRWVMPRLIHHWDGGPVEIEGTVEEGEEIAGFRVIHLPGHAPGLIGLWRESDRLALVSDCFYTLDPQTGRRGHPRVPHVAFNKNTEQARASIRKLAELDPNAAWPGHAEPLTGDVAGKLRWAADNT